MQTHSTSAIPLPEAGRPGARIWGTTDAFVEHGPVLGRKVANATFLEAFLRLDPFDAYHFFLSGPEEDAALRAWLRERCSGILRRKAVCIGRHEHLHKSLSEIPYRCMHLSDGVTRFTQLVRLRNAVAPSLFPVTGVTHSLSYERFMPAYLKHLWSGVSPRDALIVTSESVRLVMDAVFDGLRRAYGLSREDFPRPLLEKIPLGVDPQSLPCPAERWDAPKSAPRIPPVPGGAPVADHGMAAGEMRSRLGVDREVLFLYFGRICPYSKMDLMPVFSALRRAEGMGLPANGYALILAGWADEDQALPLALRQYAESLGIRLITLLRPTDAERRALYAAADVFLSPSDNIQESFGLTVAEAGAAGLPVIASDFDGYRDIVLHGKTGMLVPVLGFTDTTETDLLATFWFDNQYHLKLSQSCAVHVPALAEALAGLGTDAALRRRMGEAGRIRIREQFSWEAVIKRYMACWDKLAERPLTQNEEQRLRAAEHPQRMRFGEYFRGHFSHTLDPAWLERVLLRRTETGGTLYKGALPLAHYAGMEHFLDGEAVRRMLLAARKPVPGTLLMRSLLLFFQERAPGPFVRERAAFTLLWALKHDYLEYIHNDGTIGVFSGL
ncbi:MAG: glycosyltransferase family 4 protein [Desulfovibrio sp.]|jgi:glycosyltransferase involved in cell wall biosynthesis|nr:glycosyltransferase family 4 protein [Desulfovibrio sp.]